MQINRLSEALGAEITGIDVSKIGVNTCREIETVFHHNQVIVFRDQEITPEQQIQFSRNFGPLEIHISKKFLHKEHEEILLVTNKKEDGKYIGVEEEPRFPMVTDTDPESETFGKRIKEKDKESVGIKLKYTLELTDKNIADFKVMSAAIGDPFGETRFIWKFKERAIASDNVKNFWNLSWEEAHKRFIERSKQVIEIEQTEESKPREKPKQVIEVEQTNKHDDRHRGSKKAE